MAMLGKVLRFFAVALSASGLGLACPSAQAEILQPHGSHVAIDAPDGFKLADQFTGLQRDDGATFVFVELPVAAYEQFGGQMSPEQLRQARFENASPLTLKRDGRYMAYQGELDVDGIGPMKRFLMVTVDDETTALVTANIPTRLIESGAVKRETVIYALESVTLRPASATKPRFTLAYTGPFKRAGELMGAITLYNLDGKLPDEIVPKPRPNFSVMLSIDNQYIGDVRVVAKQLLAPSKLRSDLEIATEKPIDLAGLSGWEHVAKATDLPSGETIGVYAVMVAGERGGYARFEGMAPAAEFDALLPEFRKMAASFSLAK